MYYSHGVVRANTRKNITDKRDTEFGGIFSIFKNEVTLYIVS